MAKKRVFSGVQPSGGIHIGNYLGAISRWVREQDQHDNIFCIVDLHAVTVEHDPARLRQQTLELAGLVVACGLDPHTCALFVQSHVVAHSELAWLLCCLTPLGWLERMTQYKSKAERQASVGAGLLVYPVLMAADILLYDIDQVPVGEDQKQHVELTRDIAQRFNHHFGETFVVPEVVIRQSGARIMGLDDPEKKMSKSDLAPHHAVRLLDPPDQIRRTILRAVTDSGQETRFAHAGPGVLNLLTIFEALSGWERPRIEAHVEGRGYGFLKNEVADRVIAALGPIQQRYRELADDPAALERLLGQGADRVRPRAEATLQRVHERMGFLPRADPAGRDG
jgi:tryptophanyl-tRNA synthetase